MNQRKIGVILTYINIIVKNLVFFIYTPLLLKYLGQVEYGLYQMVNSVIMSLSLLSMGFSGAYVRFYMRAKSKNNLKEINKLNGLYIILFSIMSILSIIIGCILILNINKIFSKSLTYDELNITRQLMIIMIFNIAITFPSSVFDSYIMVNEQFKFQQTRQFYQTIIAPMIIIPLIVMGYKSVMVVIIQTILTLLFFFLNFRFAIFKLKMSFDFKDLSFQLLKELSIFSSFVFLNQVVELVNNNVPNFLIGMLSGAKEVAVFSIANQIKSIFFMLSVALSGVFIPKVNEMVSSKDDNNELTMLMIKLGRMQFTILSFILGGFIVVGKYFIDIWAGNENEQAYYILIIMMLPVLVPLSQNIGIEIQRAKNKHFFRALSYTILAFINVILSVIFIKKYGAIGATVGYVTAVTLGNGLLINWYNHSRLGLNMILFWKKILNILVPFVVVTSILLLMQKTFPIINLYLFFSYGIIYIISYVCLYLIFSANEEEKKLLFNRFK